MKNINKVRNTPQDIETIINSFNEYALGDIRFIKSRPVAAFILSICFIEQLSILRYEFQANDDSKPEWFFKEYMKAYSGISLYKKARNTLVHNYSSGGEFDIDDKGYENVAYEIKEGLYKTEVIEKIVADFRNTEHEANEWALHNSMYYPVLVHTKRVTFLPISLSRYCT